MKGVEFMSINSFLIGIVIGTILGVVLMCLFITAGRADRADKADKSGLDEERRTELLERMWDIFERNNLIIPEIASIIRTGKIENERMLTAQNQLADMILDEKLTIAEVTDLFNHCYDILFYLEVGAG